MDINFLFGEHYIESYSSFWSSLLISFLGAFFGFLLALMSNKWIDNRKAKKLNEEKNIARFDTLKHLETLIDSSLSQIKSQIQKYKDCAEKIKLKPLEIHIPEFVSSDDLNRIKNLDKQYIISSFLQFYPNERNIISDLFIYIDFAERRLEESYSENKRHIEFTFKDQLIIQESADNISINIALNLMNLSMDLRDKVNDSVDYKYLLRFQQIFQKISSVQPLDFERIKNDYFLQLISTMTEHVSDRALINDFTFTIRKTLNKIQNVEANSIQYSDGLVNIKKEFEKTIKKLAIVKDKLAELTHPNRVGSR